MQTVASSFTGVGSEETFLRDCIPRKVQCIVMQQVKKPKALKEELLQEHEAQNMGTTRGDMGHSLWGPPGETP